MSHIEIWHNILWSRYKGRVFAALHRLANAEHQDVRFVHMAETETARIAIAPVDLLFHPYPYALLYAGPINRLRWWRTMPRFFWRGLTSRADFVVIAGYAEPQNWAQMFGLMIRGVPRGVFADSTLHDSPQSRVRGLAKRVFFRHVQLVFHYGERAAAMVRHFGASPAALVQRCQAAALPDGYDPGAIPGQRSALISPTPRFLYVGRLAPEKNLERLLDAFAALRTEQPAAELRLAGDGPLRSELARRAGDGVTFLGALDQAATAGEYLGATALVLPSLREPWGVVVNEALAYGCPVLVSDHCGCVPELVRADTGIVFDPLDEGALLAGLRRLAAAPLPPEPCLAAVADFTPERAAREMLDGITTYLAHHPPRAGRHGR